MKARHTWFSATSCRMTAVDSYGAKPIAQVQKEKRLRKRAQWFFSQRWLIYTLALLSFPFRKKEKAVQIVAVAVSFAQLTTAAIA